MNSRPAQGAIFLLLALFWATVAGAHPIPDIPVRTYFPGDGTARVTVEVDPRCFDEDPATAPSLVPAKLATLPEEKKAELQRKATEFVERCIEFHLTPEGQVKPPFAFSFTVKKGGGPLLGPDDFVVLTGEWNTTLPADATGWHIRSTKAGKLSVIFQNVIDGEMHERVPVLFPGESSFTLDLTHVAKKSAWDRWFTFFQRVREGFHHVVPEGLDHILFVLGLFLLSRAWKPLLAQVTTFTLAHSITLALAALKVVEVPSSIVEPIIAASITAVAVENIFHPRYTHWRLLVVFVFGLVHGLGFASALGELPQGTFVVSLVGFNVGVEGGQLAVITAAFAATFWIRDPQVYRRWVVIPGSIAIAGVGAY